MLTINMKACTFPNIPFSPFRVPGATHDPIALRLFIPELFALFGSLITFITCAVYPTDLPPFDPIERTPLEQSEEQNLETEL